MVQIPFVGFPVTHKPTFVQTEFLAGSLFAEAPSRYWIGPATLNRHYMIVNQ